MQDDDLFAQHAPDNEQRFDQDRQVGEEGSRAKPAASAIIKKSKSRLDRKSVESFAETEKIVSWRPTKNSKGNREE